MSLYRAAVTGEYEPQGNPADADCILAFSFGSRVHDSDRDANAYLAMQLQELRAARGLPVIAQGEVEMYLPPDQRIEYPVRGEPSTTFGRGVTARTVLDAAFEYMRHNQRCHPLLITQAHMVGRVAAMAARYEGIEPIVPEGLPAEFTADSNQWWTRGPKRWALREIPLLTLLQLRGEI